MTKVYVHYAKLNFESKPRVSVYLNKEDADEQKQEYVEAGKRMKTSKVTKNQIKVVTF